MRWPAAAAASYPLADGIVGLAGGLGWLPESRALVAADAHFAYEDVVGGALPLWSTEEIAARIEIAIAHMQAREVIFLGDVIHSSRMSAGAARRVIAALAGLRSRARLTIVAGNHEGMSRGIATLGSVAEEVVRDGWLLVHGDRPKVLQDRVLIGHVHPSLRIGGSQSVPVFVGSENLVVLPALTPYSSGLSVVSRDCSAALAAWTGVRREFHVVAATSDAVYPFGSLERLRALILAQPAERPHRFRRRLGAG